MFYLCPQASMKLKAGKFKFFFCGNKMPHTQSQLELNWLSRIEE